jgi:hypothetical protein
MWFLPMSNSYDKRVAHWKDSRADGCGFFWWKLSWHASLHPWWKLLCQTNWSLVARRRSFGKIRECKGTGAFTLAFVNDPFFLLDLYAYASLNSC